MSNVSVPFIDLDRMVRSRLRNMISAFARFVMRVVYSRMTLAEDGVSATRLRRLAVFEANKHEVTGAWPWGEQVLTDEVFMSDPASYMAMRTSFLNTPGGFEAYQLSDHLLVPAGFAWHE